MIFQSKPDAVSLTGNTAGAMTVVSTGTVVFAGGSNITLSQNANTISIVGASGGGNGSITLSAGTLSAARSDVTFSNSNGVSFGLNTDGVITATVQTNYLTTAMASNRGSDFVAATAAFNGTNASGTLASNAWSVSVAAQTNQTVGLYASSNTYLTSSGTVDARSLSFRGDKSITVGISAGEVLFSVGAYLTTARRSTDAIGLNTAQTNVTWTVNSSGLSLDAGAYAGTNGAITGGSITVNTSGVSVNLPAYLSTQSTQYLALTLGGNTSGTTTFNASNNATLFFNGGNNITLSGNGSTVTISAAAQTTQSAIKGFGATNTGNTAGNTGLSTGIDWVLAGSNNITVSQSTTAGGPNTLWVSGPTAAAAQTGISGIVVSDTTYTSGTVSFSNAGNITIGSSVNGATQYIKLSGNAAQTVQTQNCVDVTLGGNTSGALALVSSGTLFLAGGANITLSQNGNSVTISAPTPGTASNAVAMSVSAGNTTGTLTIVSSGTIYLAGGNGVTLSQNAQSLTWSVSTYSTVGTATSGYPVASDNSIGTVTRWAAEDHRHAGVGGLGISTAGNTSGTTGSEVGTYWLQGGNNVTLSQITSNNGSHTLIVSGPVQPSVRYFEPYSLTNTVLFGPAAGSWYFAPFVAHGSMSGGRLNFLQQHTSTANLFIDNNAAYSSNLSGQLSQGYTYSKVAALYSQGTGANSTRLESIWSNSFSFGWSKSVSVSTSNVSQFNLQVRHSLSYIADIGSDGAYTLSQFASSNTTATAGSSAPATWGSSIFISGRNMLSGSLVVPVGFNTTITEGNYWLAQAWSSTRASSTTVANAVGASTADFSWSSDVGISRLALDSLYRNFGSTVTTARSGLLPYGVYTAAANMAPPQYVALSSDLSSLASAWVPYFNFVYQGLTK